MGAFSGPFSRMNLSLLANWFSLRRTFRIFNLWTWTIIWGYVSVFWVASCKLGSQQVLPVLAYKTLEISCNACKDQYACTLSRFGQTTYKAMVAVTYKKITRRGNCSLKSNVRKDSSLLPIEAEASNHSSIKLITNAIFNI